jgi:hypothetical protein
MNEIEKSGSFFFVSRFVPMLLGVRYKSGALLVH